MGSNDPGAAARKQYGGFDTRSVAPIDKTPDKSNNGAAAPIPRSTSPQLPGLGASRWAQPTQANPIPRASSPQLPGLGASRWAAPPPAQVNNDGNNKAFVQPTPLKRNNNNGGKKNFRKGW